jgi:signal transduction histidine kinase
VQADAALLRSALQKVLDNAVKFTANKGLREIAVSAGVDAASARVRLQIRDNGAGFNPALQSKLFKPFSRLHTVKQFPGIGMGLALTRKMLERMGAQVAAQGAVDAGCTVTLSLPCA